MSAASDAAEQERMAQACEPIQRKLAVSALTMAGLDTGVAICSLSAALVQLSVIANAPRAVVEAMVSAGFAGAEAASVAAEKTPS